MARKRKEYESRDVAAAAARMIRGLVRRAGTGDQEALYELAQLQEILSAATNEAGARYYLSSPDATWSVVAGELGITRQGARQRFAPLVAQLRAAAGT